MRRGRAGIVYSNRRGRAGIVHSNNRGRAGIVFSNCRGRAGTRALPFATVGCPFGANDLRPNGANYDSLGHRPRKGIPPTNIRALKGRLIFPRVEFGPGWNAPSGLNSFANLLPTAMPWAGMKRPVGAEDKMP